MLSIENEKKKRHLSSVQDFFFGDDLLDDHTQNGKTMSAAEIKSRFHILHLEVSHGSDRFDIHLHMERPLLVRDLMEEVEKKARVTLQNQQILYRGQRLHVNPDVPLSKFALFNGNRLTLIGEKLSGIEDEHFRRFLSFEKDVKLIDDVVELVCRDFDRIRQSGQPRENCETFLDDLRARAERCRSDLQTFSSMAKNVQVAGSEPDSLRKKHQVISIIEDRINISSNILSAINSYQGGDHSS